MSKSSRSSNQTDLNGLLTDTNSKDIEKLQKKNGVPLFKQEEMIRKNHQAKSTATYVAGSALASIMLNSFSNIKALIPTLGRVAIGGSFGESISNNATAATVLAIAGVSIAAAYSTNQYLSCNTSKCTTENKDQKGSKCVGAIATIAALSAATMYTSHDPISNHVSMTNVLSSWVGGVQANVLSGLTQIAGLYGIYQGTKIAYNPCASAVIKLKNKVEKYSKKLKSVVKDVPVKTSAGMAVVSGIGVHARTTNIPLILSGVAVGAVVGCWTHATAENGFRIIKKIGKEFLNNRWREIKDINNPATRMVATGVFLNAVARSATPLAESVCGSSWKVSLLANIGVMTATVTTDKWRPKVLKAAGGATQKLISNVRNMPITETLVNRVRNTPTKVKVWAGLAVTAATTGAWLWMSRSNGAEEALATTVQNTNHLIGQVHCATSSFANETFGSIPSSSLMNTTPGLRQVVTCISSRAPSMSTGPGLF